MAPIAAKRETDLRGAMAGGVGAALAQRGFDPVGSDAATLAAFIEEETARRGGVARKAGSRPASTAHALPRARGRAGADYEFRGSSGFTRCTTDAMAASGVFMPSTAASASSRKMSPARCASSKAGSGTRATRSTRRSSSA